MKKKVYTPKQQLTRFFFAVTVVAVMIVFVLITKKTSKSDTVEPVATEINHISDSISIRMNELLDSVDASRLIKGNPVFIDNDAWELKTEENVHDEEIAALEEMLEDPHFESVSEVITAKRDSLKKLDKEEPVVSYYWRKVYYLDRESQKKYRVFQSANKDLTQTTISNAKEIEK